MQRILATFTGRAAAKERRLVARSPLYDEDWYRLSAPTIVRKGVSPLHHIVGQRRPPYLSPSRAFDAQWYADRYPEVIEARCHPLVHYLKTGSKRGYEIRPAAPSEADRIAESGLFDPEWYLDTHQDVAAANFPPLLHYMAYGWLEGRATSAEFDGERYLKRYPDIRGMNPLLHFVDHGRREGRNARPHGKVIDHARAALAGVEDLDPELYGLDYFADPDLLEVVDGSTHNIVDRALAVLVSEIGTPPSHIVFLPWLIHGGSDLVACHAVRAIAEARGPEAVLVVLTDHDREEALRLLPDGVRKISFSRTQPTLTTKERTDLVELLVRGLQPEAILNVNSRACWEMMRYRGRLIRNFTRSYAMLFCPDFLPDGRRGGYSDLYLRDSLPMLSGVYFDNATFIEEVCADFSIPDAYRDRLVTLHQPAPPLRPVRTPEPARTGPFRLLWAGRLSRQKNIDLLIRIGEALPDTVELHIWGRGDALMTEAVTELAARRANVTFEGAYDSFDALPLDRYDAFLYTSLWDGIPNVLLECGAAGLPIVASVVGGIGEVIDRSTGLPVRDGKRPEPYLAAIAALVGDYPAALRRAAAFQARLAERHTWDRYRATLAAAPVQTKGLLHVEANDHRGAERAPRGHAGKAVAQKPRPVRRPRKTGRV
jgi:glycosyltransferase involved in cell wall biosynthesis